MPKPVHNEGKSANANIGGNVGGNTNFPGSPKVSVRHSQSIFHQVNNNLGKNPNHSKNGKHNNSVHSKNSPPPQAKAAHHQNNSESANNRQNNLVRGIIAEVLRQNDIYPDDKTLKKLVGDSPSHDKAGKSNAETLFDNKDVKKMINEVRSLVDNLIPNEKNADKMLRDIRSVSKNGGNLVEKLVDKHLFPNKNNSPKPQNPPTGKTGDLLGYVKEQIFSLLDNSSESGKKLGEKITAEFSRQFREQLESSKNTITRATDSGAKTFNQLTTGERMQAAVKILLSELPPDISKSLKNYSPEEILSGLLLARGLIAGREKNADLRNLISIQPPILPKEISLKSLHNIGQIVKVLISAAALAKTTANLDLAVQKFVRILLSNNEIGGLLAAVQLASQIQNSAVPANRSAALVQIYELIARLVATGEKMLQNEMPSAAAKNILQTNAKGEIALIGVAKNLENDEQITHFLKNHAAGAESALRQFLEFNPMAASDNSASAFDSFDDASRAQRDFVSIYQDDIDSWLKSGNHRFVKEIELENPVGVVVERSREDVFESSKVRIVLVRDGSVAGWHFLKSFLVA